MKQALGISIKTKKEIKTYTVRWRENGEERQCKSIEYPRPELDDTLDAFVEFIPDIAGITKEKMVWAEIAGATFEYAKDGTASLSLGVAVGIVGTGEINFKTPGIPVDFDGADINSAETWLEKYGALAQFLHDEIIMYAEGKRAQSELAFDTVEAGQDEPTD